MFFFFKDWIQIASYWIVSSAPLICRIYPQPRSIIPLEITFGVENYGLDWLICSL